MISHASRVVTRWSAGTAVLLTGLAITLGGAGIARAARVPQGDMGTGLLSVCWVGRR